MWKWDECDICKKKKKASTVCVCNTTTTCVNTWTVMGQSHCLAEQFGNSSPNSNVYASDQQAALLLGIYPPNTHTPAK